VTRRPDFFLVGAPKSGTTAMYEYLRAHPALYLPARKELRFFGSDLEIRDRVALSTEEYLGYFRDAQPSQRVGTAYVWYLFSQNAAEEIARFSPRAQILMMLRNPVQMLHALHGEHLSNGNEDIRDFDEALRAEPERRAGRRIPPHAHLPQGLWYSAVPRYAEQVQRYLDVFGPDRVHVTIFDDFASDPGGSYRATLDFLGVEDAAPPSFDVINAAKRTRSEAIRHFLARPPELPRRAIRRTVPAPVRRWLYERAKRLNVTSQRRPPMRAATEVMLRREFASDVDRLSTLLDRDLRHWTSEPGPTSPRVEPAPRSEQA
jgi:hypothetical protein